MEQLSDNRKEAIELARSFGWSVTRKSSRQWEFTRPDTGGLWDLFRISHASLSIGSVLTKFENYEPDLGGPTLRAVNEARRKCHADWLEKRRPLLAKEQDQ